MRRFKTERYSYSRLPGHTLFLAAILLLNQLGACSTGTAGATGMAGAGIAGAGTAGMPGTAGVADGGADIHRAASSACPQERGAGISGLPTQCESSARASCTRDSDCVAGANGRCLQALGPACGYHCSYDDCTQDSDCTANAPCACRSSSSATGPNICATGSDCRVDADCGLGGFCSPSLVGSPCQCIGEIFCPADAGRAELCGGDCGHGYFCHTPKDGCLNDGDCASGACNFDLTSRAWMCTRISCPS